MTQTKLSRAAAAGILAVPPSALKNYMAGQEFGQLKARERLTPEALESWRHLHPQALVPKEGYLQSLQFAVEQYYGGGARSDFGSSVRRTAGKFIDDHVRGKLGELGFAKFAADSHHIELRLDFEHRVGIPAQDITEVRRVKSRSWNPVGMRVSIKATKVGGTYLLVPQTELENSDRRSDAYVLVRVALPDDHLIRLILETEDLRSLRAKLADLKPLSGVSAQVVGFAWRDDFKRPAITSLPGFELGRPNYMLMGGELRTSRSDWATFFDRLVGA